MKEILNRLASIGIVPVVKIREAEDSIPLAQALMEGGIDCVEVTFRSEHAAFAIQQITKHIPDMLVGAGTITTLAQAKEAIDAGATFLVSPGLNPALVTYCKEQGVLLIPGIATASELDQAVSLGLENVKLFPAGSSGGPQKIKDLSGPYANVRFMPTGGVNMDNMHTYLQLPNVLAVGGSFMLPEAEVISKNWSAITDLCKAAIKEMLSYSLIHIGVDHENKEEAMKSATVLATLFDFPIYEKPKSVFASKGFELLHQTTKYTHGHFGIYTPYPNRALYHLKKKGISCIEDTITRNKKTGLINFVYLDLELAGFGFHLINPDVKM